MFTSYSYADVTKNDIAVTGTYMSGDGRVSGQEFKINIKLKSDGTFSGEMDAWIGLYLSDGNERVDIYKQKIGGKWSIEKETILLQESNKLLPKSSVLKSSTGLKVIVNK